MRNMHEIGQGMSVYIKLVSRHDKYRVRLRTAIDLAGTGQNMYECTFASSHSETNAE
jgi:hypothetical protein